MVMSNPRAELPEDAQIVKYQDGVEHGYYGVTPDTEDDHVYTVAGVTEDDSGSTSKHGASKPASRPASKETSK